MEIYSNTTRFAFACNQSNKIIEPLQSRCAILRYAKLTDPYFYPISDGAIRGYGATGWRILDNEVTDNKPGAGVEVFTGRLVRGNDIHHNGQLGVTCQANSNGAVVDTNDIHDNNVGRVFDPNNAAGGFKCVKASNLTVRGNHVYRNDGTGIWCDFCLAGTQYLGNLVEDNTFVGIFHEASVGVAIWDATFCGMGARTEAGSG